MKSVYLAAAFHRQAEMREFAKEIEALGVRVTARWLTEDPSPTDPIEREKFLEKTAIMDMDDIEQADVLIRFSDDLSHPFVPSDWCTSSRMEESGMATAWGKQVVVVGGKQSLFDRLLNRVHIQTKEGLIQWIKWTRDWECLSPQEARDAHDYSY